MPVVAPNAFAREVARTIGALARTARSRRLYAADNSSYVRMLDELERSFSALLQSIDTLDLRVRPQALVFDDISVLDEPNPDDSLPFALYRDGLRRLSFERGLTRAELAVFVDAVAAGYVSSSFGEDIVTRLWRHELEHVRYLVVDTTIVDAADLPESGPGGSSRPPSALELDAAIDGLLRRIYGDAASADVGVTSFSIDRSDLSARTIAEGLDRVDEMAPGFHPPRNFPRELAYGRELFSELEREDEARVALRAAHAVLHAIQNLAFDVPESRRLFAVLLEIYDGALIATNLRLATYLVAGVSRLPASPSRQHWLQEALSETRLRPVAQVVAEGGTGDIPGLVAFLRAAGPAAVSSVLGVLPAFSDPRDRRAVASVVAELGVPDLEPLRAMLQGEQAYVAQEAMFISSRLRDPQARALLKEAEYHPAPQVRVTLLENAKLLGDRDAIELAARLIDDLEPRVQIAAARVLARYPSRPVLNLLETKIQQAEFEEHPGELKLALLAAYVISSQTRALPILARLVKKGEGLFASKRAEETAIQALYALKGVRRAPRAAEILRQACGSRNKRVREVARAIEDAESLR